MLRFVLNIIFNMAGNRNTQIIVSIGRKVLKCFTNMVSKADSYTYTIATFIIFFKHTENIYNQLQPYYIKVLKYKQMPNIYGIIGIGLIVIGVVLVNYLGKTNS